MRIAVGLHTKGRFETITPRGASGPGLTFSTVLACVLVACGGAKPVLAPSVLPPRPAGALEVRLEMSEAADLDLHVTDPSLETVYFGNTPSVSGGRLDRDVRCEAEGGGEGDGEGEVRRVETVRFETPKPGRWRVGVDYVKGCRRLRNDAAYVIRVVAPGLELERAGEIGPGTFENEALEFDWPGEAGASGEP